MDKFIEEGFGDTKLFEALYQAYLANPDSVDPSWRQVFERFDAIEAAAPAEGPPPRKEEAAIPVRTVYISGEGDTRVANLIENYRTYGHLMASVDPISTKEPLELEQLKLESFGFHKEELDTVFPTRGVLREAEAPLRKIIDTLKAIYCGTISVEYMGLPNRDLQKWLQERIELSRFKPDFSIDDKRLILQHLNKSELLESFLHTKYVGQKRFSLEGEETLIPMLNSVTEYGAELGCQEVVIGMAHRGRLNVLVNILNKSYKEIFTEFEDSFIPESVAGSGDLKYHKGYTSSVTTAKGKTVKISVTSNPSHLEAVDPVVEGQVFAKQVLIGDDKTKERVIPVLIHGDAAIAGQGVVYETMQLSKLRSYSTGGTLHIVINNQIGFTTLPGGARSTHYCTDIAHAFGAPVFHVNAEDPERCVLAINLALEARARFHCDVFIDLNGYRKYGHNEADEPSFTQPLECQLISKKRPIRELYRDHLIKQGVLERYMAETLEGEFKKALEKALKSVHVREGVAPRAEKSEERPQGFFAAVDTAVSLKTLQDIIVQAHSVPKGFHPHPKLMKLLDERGGVAKRSPDIKNVDWGLGEILAFGSLIREGASVRLSGQDSRRGTFGHRHAMWIDQENAKRYFPLHAISEAQGRCDVINSPLAEYAVLGFEYGYSIASPETLVMWEAQFGDFCNGAQIIIDQFIATGEQKWGVISPLVLLLPHGFEGQGPEHSSARMERFLLLCGNYNLQVAYPTTPAQMFHLLRRQAKRAKKTPLVVFTPKGLLKNPDCRSALSEFTVGVFQEIIDDTVQAEKIERIVFCSGRIYYDLLSARETFAAKDLAIIRIEQLYPFHLSLFKEIMARYTQVHSCFWVQEEPSNMGAWRSIKGHIEEGLPKGLSLKYIGRKPSASPATGSLNAHKKQLQALISAVFASEEQPFYEMSYHTAPA